MGKTYEPEELIELVTSKLDKSGLPANPKSIYAFIRSAYKISAADRLKIRQLLGIARVNTRRESLPLTNEEWAELERLAIEFNTKAGAGTSAGKPSWRTLVKDIANGKIYLIRVFD